MSFNIVGVLDTPTRRSQMEHAISLGIPRMKEEKRKAGALTLACYGPSLAYTWTKIKRPLMTVSGAHDFLIDGGIVPDYHVDMDPREHKSKFVENSHPNVRYLMASVCHPQTWENLLGRNVEMWHLIDSDYTDEWLQANEPGSLSIGGGTTVGERAFLLGMLLGYSKFEIHGMDYSFGANGNHAGDHPTKHKEEMLVKVNGDVFKTCPEFFESAKAMLSLISKLNVQVTFHGYGFLQALARETKLIKPERKAA